MAAVSVTTRKGPAVSVVSRGRTVVSTVAMPGPQGARGAKGETGQQGEPGDYGYIAYAQSLSTPVLFPAQTRTLLTFTPDSLLTRDKLKGPFAGHVFWDGMRLRPKSVNDNAEIRLILAISALVIGGRVVADIDIGGSIGAFETDPRTLTAPAGTNEPVRFLFIDYMAETFLANGGAFYLTPSVPIMVTSESLVVYPRGAGT